MDINQIDMDKGLRFKMNRDRPIMWFERNRQQFGVKRRKEARPPRNADFGDLCTMRDLRKAAITPSMVA